MNLGSCRRGPIDRTGRSWKHQEGLGQIGVGGVAAAEIPLWVMHGIMVTGDYFFKLFHCLKMAVIALPTTCNPSARPN